MLNYNYYLKAMYDLGENIRNIRFIQAEYDSKKRTSCYHQKIFNNQQRKI